MTNRKSPTAFPTSYRWSVYVTGCQGIPKNILNTWKLLLCDGLCMCSNFFCTFPYIHVVRPRAFVICDAIIYSKRPLLRLRPLPSNNDELSAVKAHSPDSTYRVILKPSEVSAPLDRGRQGGLGRHGRGAAGHVGSIDNLNRCRVVATRYRPHKCNLL